MRSTAMADAIGLVRTIDEQGLDQPAIWHMVTALEPSEAAELVVTLSVMVAKIRDMAPGESDDYLAALARWAEDQEE